MCESGFGVSEFKGNGEANRPSEACDYLRSSLPLEQKYLLSAFRSRSPLSAGLICLLFSFFPEKGVTALSLSLLLPVQSSGGTVTLWITAAT